MMFSENSQRIILNKKGQEFNIRGAPQGRPRHVAAPSRRPKPSHAVMSRHVAARDEEQSQRRHGKLCYSCVYGIMPHPIGASRHVTNYRPQSMHVMTRRGRAMGNSRSGKTGGKEGFADLVRRMG